MPKEVIYIGDPSLISGCPRKSDPIPPHPVCVMWCPGRIQGRCPFSSYDVMNHSKKYFAFVNEDIP